MFVFVSNRQSLLCGNRLDEVIDARKKWLKPDGLIFPDRSTLYIAAIDNSILIDRSNFWQHVQKFDMRSMIQAVSSEPYLQNVKMAQVRVLALKHYFVVILVFRNISDCNKCLPNQADKYVHS